MRMKSEKELLLESAAAEIKQLRHHNGLMSARLQMFDDVMLLFRTPPMYSTHGMTEDLVYRIEQHLKSGENERD